MDNKLIKVSICSGTACFVMGGSELLLLEDELPEAWRGRVSLEASPCLGYCKDRSCGRAPFVSLDGERLDAVTMPALLSRIGEKLGQTAIQPNETREG